MPSKSAKTKPAAKPRAKPAKPKRNRQTAQPAYAAAAAIRAQVLDLRILGLSLDEIGARVGRSRSVVHTHLKNALAEIDGEQKDKATQYRALAYARLERLLKKAMLLGASGNLKAMHEAQRLIMGQARIMGFDAPIKHAQTDPTGDFERAPGAWTLPARPDATIEQWQAEAARVWEEQKRREQANLSS